MDGESRDIAGLMPEGFDMPRGIPLLDFFIPMIMIWDILGLAIQTSAKDRGITPEFNATKIAKLWQIF